MSTADEMREQARTCWSESAAYWGAAAEDMRRYGTPVSQWIVDRARLAPGMRVLELAAGAAETGLLAAEAVAPGGSVLITDAVEPMVEVARERAKAAGATNVDFKVVDAEWIDEPTASFDAIVCRWGLMFPVDLEAAFRECRRVLRPGARLATSCWTAPERNPWATEINQELLDQGLTEPPPPGDAPGPFRLSDPGRLIALFEGAGFTEITVEPMPLPQVFEDFEAFWDLHSELSTGIRRARAMTNERSMAALKEGLAARLERYRREDGRLEIAYEPLMAVAEA